MRGGGRLNNPSSTISLATPVAKRDASAPDNYRDWRRRPQRSASRAACAAVPGETPASSTRPRSSNPGPLFFPGLDTRNVQHCCTRRWLAHSHRVMTHRVFPRPLTQLEKLGGRRFLVDVLSYSQQGQHKNDPSWLRLRKCGALKSSHVNNGVFLISRVCAKFPARGQRRLFYI